jgi:hypothetical protein
MSHTPGPWKPTVTFDYGWRVEHCEQNPVFIGSGSVGIARLIWFGKTTEEFKANANLIAAAPELLEALTRLVELGALRGNSFGKDDLRQAREAIAKAEGKCYGS